MVRDEVTVVGTNLDYHRSIGVDEFWVIDNGSTDGTTEILERQSRLHGDVHWRSDSGPYLESEIAADRSSFGGNLGGS